MKIWAVILITLLVLPLSAYAYVGPGMGVGVIGAIIGIFAAIVLSIVGLVWFPLKRAFGGASKKESEEKKEEPKE